MARPIMYTGYYAKTKKYEEAGLKPVAVSGKVPPFFKGDRIKEFAPRFETFSRWKNKEITNEEYETEYRDYLNTLNKDSICKYLGNNIILICYEKSGDFCHRHTLARWLMDNFCVEVIEWREADGK